MPRIHRSYFRIHDQCWLLSWNKISKKSKKSLKSIIPLHIFCIQRGSNIVLDTTLIVGGKSDQLFFPLVKIGRGRANICFNICFILIQSPYFHNFWIFWMKYFTVWVNDASVGGYMCKCLLFKGREFVSFWWIEEKISFRGEGWKYLYAHLNAFCKWTSKSPPQIFPYTWILQILIFSKEISRSPLKYKEKLLLYFEIAQDLGRLNDWINLASPQKFYF